MGKYEAEADNIISKLISPPVRRWLYGIAVAVCGILSVKGYIDAPLQGALYTLFGALFLVAGANTPTVTKDE